MSPPKLFTEMSCQYVGRALPTASTHNNFALPRASPHDCFAPHTMLLRAGAAILPQEAFKALDPAAFKAVAKLGSSVVFATAGERGAVKVWRSDNGQCILEQRCVSRQ